MRHRWRTRLWLSGAAATLVLAACETDHPSVAPQEEPAGPMLTVEPFAFRMTGGGRIDDPAALQKNEFLEPGVCDGKSFATFGFNAGPKQNGTLHGEIQWVDHCRGLKVHGYDVTAYSAISGSGHPKERGCAEWEGPARVNGVEGYTFRVEPACDEGEPGWRDPNDESDPPDWIQLIVRSADGTTIYVRQGRLTGGNIQTHPVD
jgi:hypothetical protein